MALSAFDDRSRPPRESDLEEMLARAFAAWTRLKKNLQGAYGPLAEEWNFAGKAYGWSLRLKQKDKKQRAVVYMTPGKGQFLASFALGEKACKAARESGLPSSILDAIDAAPKYAEGRGVRIPVRTMRDMDAVCRVAECKMSY